MNLQNLFLFGGIIALILFFIGRIPCSKNASQQGGGGFLPSQKGGSDCTPAYGLMENSFVKPYSLWNNLSYYFPFPYFRPYWYRNYGEMTDPYYRNSWQTYWNDLPYFYYMSQSFDRYRKEWGPDTRGNFRCKKTLRTTSHYKPKKNFRSNKKK